MKNNTSSARTSMGDETSHAPLKYHQRARAIMATALTAPQKLVLLAISDHIGASGAPVWPSVSRIASLTSLGERTVQKHLTGLGDVVEVDRTPGRANRYRVRFDLLNPRTSCTPADGAPPHDVHPTPADGAPAPAPRAPAPVPSADEAVQERIINGEENGTPQPPKGGTASEDIPKASPVDSSAESVDKSTEEAPKADRPKKRTRKKNLTAEEVCALPMPEELASMDGYHEAFAEFVAHRIEIKKPLTARALKIHNNGILKAIAAGCTPADVLFSLEEAILKRWTSAYPKPGRAAAQTPSQQPAGSKTGADTSTASAEPWDRLEAALQRFRGKPPHTGSKPWRFSDDKHTERAFMAGLKAAAEQPDHLTAWATLWNTCAASQDVRKWQRVRFLKAYKIAIRTRGAA